MFGADLVLVERLDVFLAAVEVQAADGLAVVVVEQDGAVGLRIAQGDAFDVDRVAQDGPHNVEALVLFLRRDDQLVFGRCFVLRLRCVGGRFVDRGNLRRDGRFQPFVDVVVRVLLEGALHHRAEVLQNVFRHHAVEHLFGEELDELVGGLLGLVDDVVPDGVDVFHLVGRVQNDVRVVLVMAELLQLLDVAVLEVEEVDLEEGALVHFVGRLEVGVEAVDDTVGQYAEFGWRNMVIAEQLGGVFVEVGAPMLAFDQHDRLAVQAYGIVDFLALFRAVVAVAFGGYLFGVEDVVTERLQERQYERCFGGFLGLDVVFQFDDTGRQYL